MKIPKITNTPVNNRNINSDVQKTDVSIQTCAPAEYVNVDYSKIAFGAIYNVKPKKIVNIDQEKSKLLKQISELLELNTADTDFTDIIMSAVRKSIAAVRARMIREEQIYDRMELLMQDTVSNPQQLMNEANRLKKELNQLKKFKPHFEEPKKLSSQDERIDYHLLNKFKSAITGDDYRLGRVFEQYYSGLNEVKTVEELNSRFPKIKTPTRPEEVIAKKIEATLTRDFYEDFDEVLATENTELVSNFIIINLDKMIKEIAAKSKVDYELLATKVGKPFVELILQKHDSYLQAGQGFTAVPEHRKIKIAQITENDAKLLSVDFDDFVLSTVRKLYLGGEKLNQIKYTDGTTSISLSALKDADYKFEKVPEKLKSMMNMASSIHHAQRDYDNFTVDQFKARLNYYSGKELANNEDILKLIIDFDECNFAQEDIKPLIKLLKQCDAITDGEKTIDEVVEYLRAERVSPHGTRKMNEIELQRAEENFRLRQKKFLELNIHRQSFDDAINVLYANNLNNIANTCAKYRPESLEPKDLENAEYIVKIINENFDSKSRILNKEKVQQRISRWDTYNSYELSNTKDPRFVQAQQYAKDPDGIVDVEKAGHYLCNAEIVELYPSSLEYTKVPEIVEKIISNTADKDEAIKYLCKFDSYLDMDNVDKSSIYKILELFDTKSSLDKSILKYIVENDYLKSDTVGSIVVAVDKDGKPIMATIGASAKQQLMDKYRYPRGVDYLKKFEDALSSSATSTGSSGIKNTGRNNESQKYKMELKIAGENDRMFSSNNDYYFDIFSDKGLH